jgi:hypothetical protein
LVLLGTSGLVAAHVAVALLLVALNLKTRWSWMVKASAIVIVSALYLVTYYSIPPLLGWPTEQRLPKRFHLLAVDVQEPDKASGRSGHIFLWARDLIQDGDSTEPRAYRLAYAAALGKTVQDAGEKVRKGMSQIGEVRDDMAKSTAKHASAEDTDQSQVDGAAKSADAVAGGQSSVVIDFFDTPESTLPAK